MEVPKKWLIATHGAKFANMSVSYAANLYTMMHPRPEVMILNVISKPDGGETRSRAEEEQFKEDQKQGKRILREAKDVFIQKDGKAETVSTMVAIGEPRQKIVEIAKSNNTDHIIMGGADFKWKITDLISGGVTNYVLHHMHCVITVIK